MPSHVTNAIAIAAGDRQSLALLRDGTLVVLGQSHLGQDSPPAIQRAVAAAIGGAHSLALVETATTAPAFPSSLPSLGLAWVFGASPGLIAAMPRCASASLTQHPVPPLMPYLLIQSLSSY